MFLYLIGVLVSGILWWALIKLRLNGLNITLINGEVIFQAINCKEVDFQHIMIGWVIISVFWWIAWPLLVGLFLTDALIVGVAFLWRHSLGNDKLIKKIFGVD